MARTKQKGPECRPECQPSDIIARIPKACNDELAAVEFIEAERWGSTPACVHCGSTSVYKMIDAKTGLRNHRFLWRCHDCHKQYTVRIGTVYEETRIALRHWCFAFWRMGTSKKGVSALEIMRQCQLSYKSALFLLNRIRFAMAPDASTMPPLSGIVEVDETFVGGKPRNNVYSIGRRKARTKTPVFVAVQRGGGIRRRVVARVTAKNLKEEIRQVIHPTAHLMSDENPSYKAVGKEFASHQTVEHGAMEYVRGNVHTNTVESSHAIVKRGIMGIYHNVSREYLHRYLWQFDFIWNHRQLTDGERVARLVRATDGKRLMYEDALPRMIDRRG
jgi:transposase-like protein